jgi:hypothetical protein
MASPGARKAVLAVHMAASVGWLGAALAFAALDIATVLRHDDATLRAAYVAMDLLAHWAIVPLAAAALATGVAAGLASPWGLFRHYWVVVSLAATAAAFAVLLVQLPTIASRAALAADPATQATLDAMPHLLPHSIGGSAVLAAVLALNVAKPKGLTPYGWRKAREGAQAGAREG